MATPSDNRFVFAAAAVAVVCCFGVSLVAAASGTALLSLAGLALPAAALLGIVGWIAWYVIRHR